MTDDEKSGVSGDPVSSDGPLTEATPISSSGSSGSFAQQPTSPKSVDPVQDPTTSEKQDSEPGSSGPDDADQPPEQVYPPEASQPDPDPPVAQPVVDFAPDFHLASVQGPAHRLSDYRGNQPVVVVFYRAFW
jgi:hypothetical protein